MDIETCIRNYLTSGEFNHEAYHPARDFLSGLLDITIVKPVIEFFIGTDLITGERLTEAQKYQKMAGAIVDVFTFGQGLAAMKGAGLVGKELCKAFGKTMLVEVASSASAYTVGYGVEAMGLPPQIAWMLGAATGCIVSTVGMNLVFRNPKTGVVRECSLEEITSLEKLDASEIDITKLGKEVPADDLELYMRYQKEGSIEHFTDGEKKTISRIETMGITGNECEEILRARGREVNRPPREEPEAVLPPRKESEGKGGTDALKFNNWDDMKDTYKGTVTQFVKENKPKYSPNIKKWFDNGGSIEVQDIDGKQIWTYTSAAGDSVPYIDGYIKFPDEYLNPTIKSVDIGEFTGDRGKDIDKMLEILEEDYGITEIPEGYIVHHDIENGILQLVDENIHTEFTHIGGHSIYK